MRLRLKLTLLFTLIQIAAALAIGISMDAMIRKVIIQLVEEESRQMVSSIADAVEMTVKSSDDFSVAFNDIRAYVLNRKIGKTGFYFVLDEYGTYIIHAKESVEGKNWLGREAFIDYIVTHRTGELSERFRRYISPKTGEWKQVYFEYIDDLDWTVCSSAWENEMYAPVQRIRLLLILILTIVALLNLILSLAVSGRITGILENMTHALSDLAEGDLTVTIPVDNFSLETVDAANSFNRSIPENLNHMVAGVKDAACRTSRIGEYLQENSELSRKELDRMEDLLVQLRQLMQSLGDVLSAADLSGEKLNSSSSALEKKAETLSSASEESSAAIEEITATMMNLRSVAARQSSGGEELLNDLRAYKDVMNHLLAAVKSIRNRLDEIASFNSLINDVADQTHLLAMNAAIEAARAGSAGKGFSVVSEEIGKLADSTAVHALSVGDSIRFISEDIERIAREGSNLSGKFEELEGRTGMFISAFHQVSDGTRELESGAGEISVSSGLVHEESRQINDAVEEARKVAHEVTELMERTKEVLGGSRKAFEGMDSGMQAILKAQGKISTLSLRNSESASDLEKQTRRFRTMESDDSATCLHKLDKELHHPADE